MTLTISTRITLAFLLILGLTIGISLFATKQIDVITSNTETVDAQNSEMVSALLLIDDSQQRMRDLRDRSWELYLLRELGQQVGSPQASMELWRKQATETSLYMEELESLAARYAQSAGSDSLRGIWAEMQENARTGQELLDRVGNQVEAEFAAMQEGDLPMLARSVDDVDSVRNQFTRNLVAGQDVARRLMAEGLMTTQDINDLARQSVFVVLIAVIVLAIAAIIILRLSITRPVTKLMNFARHIGSGDLTQRTDQDGTDELGQLGNAMNEMVASLADVAAQTRNATARVAAAAAEILAQTQQQSSSTAEQSASIQQIIATMEEIEQTGTQISARAGKVSEGAESTTAAARAGLENARETGRTMELARDQAQMVAENIVSLTETTQSVGDVIDTVNDIAERSKLLAFNASIEAAAAGENGKTFAVVAEEIKYLADQAKDATVQVRSLLGDMQKGISKAVMLTEESVKRAEDGKTRIDATVNAIQTLADSVTGSMQAFQQIAAGTNQQQIGVQQATESVQNIHEASEQLNTGTQQLERAAHDLSAVGEQLRSAVERYRL